MNENQMGRFCTCKQASTLGYCEIHSRPSSENPSYGEIRAQLADANDTIAILRKDQSNLNDRLAAVTRERDEANQRNEVSVKASQFYRECHDQLKAENAKLREALEISVKQDGCACDSESVDGHHLYVCYKHQALNLKTTTVPVKPELTYTENECPRCGITEMEIRESKPVSEASPDRNFSEAGACAKENGVAQEMGMQCACSKCRTLTRNVNEVKS